MNNIVIQTEHLSKMYRLGAINNGTLWKDLQTWMALKMGHEDPHSKIGEDKYAGDIDHFWALKDIDFEIEQGDRVGIIGKNGAGKSTLLKILSRVTAPTEGTVKIKGKVASLLEVGTGFHGELTGRENIYLNGAILGMKKRQIDRKIDEIINFSEIEHYIDTPVKRYSSGMYVRLAFAVAAHLDSDILIADEVLAVGDAAFQKKALGKMRDLSTGQGRTVLFVSHNMSAVQQLCSKGIVLQHGRIVCNSNLRMAVDFYFNSTTMKTFVDLQNFKPNYVKERIKVLSIERINTNRADLSFDFGERIGLRIKVRNETYSPIKIIASLSITNQNIYGVLFSVNNGIDNLFNMIDNKDYSLDFWFDNNLMPGKYIIHFGIDKDMQTIWWGTDLAIFEVNETKVLKQNHSGLIQVNSEVSIKEN